MNILIKTPNFIGDTVMMMPALELIKRVNKDAKIYIICNPYIKDLFRDKGVEKIFTINQKDPKATIFTKYGAIKELREYSFDLGFIFTNTFKDALIFKLIGVKKIVGYSSEGRKILLDFAPKRDRARHYVNNYANLVNQYYKNTFSILPKMTLHTKKQQLVPMVEGKIRLGFVFGSKKDFRSYPQELIEEFFRSYESHKYQIILLGDKNDEKLYTKYENILKDIGCDVINLAGKTTVGEYIDVINDLDLLISIDTSAIHIAAATSTKFIALIGHGTSPLCSIKPKVSFGSYLYKGEECIKDEDQIKQIKPTDIWEEISKRVRSD